MKHVIRACTICRRAQMTSESSFWCGFCSWLQVIHVLRKFIRWSTVYSSHKLSNELRRAAFLRAARAMLMKADILLLDEPTNHLDVTNVAWLETYLNNIPEVSSMIVSHDSGDLRAMLPLSCCSMYTRLFSGTCVWAC